MAREQAVRKRVLRWELWWRWALASLIGMIAANLLYNALPGSLVNPQADETIWLEQPWRVAILGCVYYAPIAFAQWLVLQRYLRQAWWWLIVTVGSVVVLYPASIWVFWIFNQWEAAWWVWFVGLEGASIYIIAQWLTLRTWIGSIRIWGIYVVATTLGWMVVLGVIVLFSADITERVNGGFANQLRAVGLGYLYQLTIGTVFCHRTENMS